MAATDRDPQKQLLTLIRDFASEKSQGERRVVGLKKRIEELRSELDAANAALEDAKRAKEIAEQELKGVELESALNDASIQALEGRTCVIQDEISSVRAEVQALKTDEGVKRDEFIEKMVEYNAKIRKFQETMQAKVQEDNSHEGAAEGKKLMEKGEAHKISEKVVPEVDARALEDMLANVVSQTTKEEQEYIAEQKIQKQVQQEYADLQKKVSLMEMIMKETKSLQDLRKQTSDLEEVCASLGNDLQQRFICPGCNTDNVEALSGLLQANEAH